MTQLMVDSSPVAWSAMKVMMEPMMNKASLIRNLSISAMVGVWFFAVWCVQVLTVPLQITAFFFSCYNVCVHLVSSYFSKLFCEVKLISCALSGHVNPVTSELWLKAAVEAGGWSVGQEQPMLCPPWGGGWPGLAAARVSFLAGRYVEVVTVLT